MITCMGLVVGLVNSVYAQDVLNQCAKWLKGYKHLLNVYPKFTIDRVEYFTVIDSLIEDGEVFILCRMYDGSTLMGTSK